MCFRTVFLTTEDPDERQLTVFPLSRTAPVNLFALIRLKDINYESSQLKAKSNKMAEKKEKFGYQGQCKRRKKSERVDDIVELKRIRFRVIDST